MLRSPSAHAQWDAGCSLSQLPTQMAAASVLLSFPAASAYAQVHVPPPWIFWGLPVKSDLRRQMASRFQSVLSYHANVFISLNVRTTSLIPTMGCCRQGNQRKQD